MKNSLSLSTITDDLAFELAGDKKCRNLNCVATFYVSSYNSEDTILRSILSILHQSVSFEFCVSVVDDGSSDSTFEILEKLSSTNRNLRVFRNTVNLGALPAVKLARTIALNTCNSSKYIALGSDHDLWASDFLSRGVAGLNLHNNVFLYVPRFLRFSELDLVKFHFTDLRGPDIGFNSLTGIEILHNSEALQNCRAGYWMYGLERRHTIFSSFFFENVDAPDQVYLYPAVYISGVLLDSVELIAIKSKSKLDINSRGINHLIADSFNFDLRVQNKFERFMTISRNYLRMNFALKRKGMHFFKFTLQLFLKMNKVPSFRLLLKKMIVRIFVWVRKVTIRLIGPCYSIFLKITLFFRLVKIRQFNSELYPSKSGKLRLGLFVTTPGILRLLETPIRAMLSHLEIELFVFATEKSWNKKVTSDHYIFVEELKKDFSNFELIFLPAHLARQLNFDTKILKRDTLRLFLNFRFYGQPDLSGEALAAQRSFGRYISDFRRYEGLDPNKTFFDLQKKYSRKSIAYYFKSFELQSMLFSPIVNAHEVEIVALSLNGKVNRIGVVASWDNLTVKGQLLDCCDSYMVWSSGQLNQMKNYHDIEFEKIDVVGPYAFDHLTKFSKPETAIIPSISGGLLDTARVGSILWLCSSAFIVDVKTRGKYSELQEIVDFISSLALEGVMVQRAMRIRLHPNCGFTIKEACDYLNSKLPDGNFLETQITKKEAITREDRQLYLELLSSSDVVVGFATSAIVEAAILGKCAISPISNLSMRSYGGLMHGVTLLSENGGPVQIFGTYKELAFFLAKPPKYSPSGRFAELIGLDLDTVRSAEVFVDFVLTRLKQGNYEK